MPSGNSRNSPLHIAEVLLEPNEGRLGLTMCPGRKDPLCNWDRDLKEDIRAIRIWGAGIVVTLIEDHEIRTLAIEDLEQQVLANKMDWVHLPILDMNVPDQRFEDRWVSVGPQLHERLDSGDRILIHCRVGLGRTGLVAARMLVERGCDPRIAIRRIRSIRPHAIQTAEQERHVLNTTTRPRSQKEKGQR